MEDLGRASAWDVGVFEVESDQDVVADGKGKRSLCMHPRLGLCRLGGARGYVYRLDSRVECEIKWEQRYADCEGC